MPRVPLSHIAAVNIPISKNHCKAIGKPREDIFLIIEKSKTKKFRFFKYNLVDFKELNRIQIKNIMIKREIKVPYAAPIIPNIGNPNFPKIKT